MIELYLDHANKEVTPTKPTANWEKCLYIEMKAVNKNPTSAMSKSILSQRFDMNPNIAHTEAEILLAVAGRSEQLYKECTKASGFKLNDGRFTITEIHNRKYEVYRSGHIGDDDVQRFIEEQDAFDQGWDNDEMNDALRSWVLENIGDFDADWDDESEVDSYHDRTESEDVNDIYVEWE
jgi:hypothetical protein